MTANAANKVFVDSNQHWTALELSLINSSLIGKSMTESHDCMRHSPSAHVWVKNLTRPQMTKPNLLI